MFIIKKSFDKIVNKSKIDMMVFYFFKSIQIIIGAKNVEKHNGLFYHKLLYYNNFDVISSNKVELSNTHVNSLVYKV